MKDAAEQVVAQAADVAGEGERRRGRLLHGGGEGVIVRAAVQRALGGRENRLVVHRQPQVPR